MVNKNTHYLKFFDNSIEIVNFSRSREGLMIKFDSNKVLSQNDIIRLSLFNYIIDAFIDDIYGVLDINGELLNYYPFFSSDIVYVNPRLGNIHKNFSNYQIDVIRKLSEKQIHFYSKLKENILNHIYKNAFKMKTSGFLFYQNKDGENFKTVIFNER